MAGQRTVYPLRLIRQDYSYTTQEVAGLFRLDVATVLRWIREEGLKPIPNTRPYLIFSRTLHDFLATRQAKRKHPCGAEEMFCLKCRLPRCVAMGTLTTQPMKNPFIRLLGRCAHCSTKMSKVVKPENWGENHPLYVCMKPSVEAHDGQHDSQPSCAVEKGEQLCLNLTL